MREKTKWLWRYYRHHPGIITVLILFTPIQAAITVTIPRMFGFTIDYLKTGAIPDHWLAQLLGRLGERFGVSASAAFAIGFVALGLASCVLYVYFQSCRAWMNLRLEWRFRQDAFDRVTHKGPDFFNRFRTGDLVTRMTDDVAEKLSWFACSGIFRTYEALLYIGFVVAAMITIDPDLTLWTTGPLPVLIVVFFVSSSLLDRRYDHLQKRISKFNDIMEACFSGIRVVKAYVREAAQKLKYEGAARDRRQAEIDAVKVTRVVDTLYNYIWQFGVVIVLIAGGYRVLLADLSVGDLATFIYYIVWLIFPMFDIGQFLVKSRQSAVSINRLIELEKVPPMVTDTDNGDGHGPVKGDLVLNDVSFSFPGSPRTILADVSLAVQAGSTVALVGKIGSGKTWLVNLIPRLVDCTGGGVRLDGRDLREYRLDELRRNIGFVPQEPILFSDTIRNNIVFGRKEISDAVIEWALDVVQLKAELAEFPKGIETEIGVRGMSISGGQKQRLALARALVGKPRILILDDCTSALDSRTEAALWDRLHEVMPGLTAVLITHRPDTLQRADRIFVLEGGRLAEAGTHDELITANGPYTSMYRRYVLEEEVVS
ncbi:MAG TPA: ABC transporter ATP-binding protein [Acidobacteriota bacterium]|nr:ABC transporter ATP-binding protein [Acidobacteriota bacterium]